MKPQILLSALFLFIPACIDAQSSSLPYVPSLQPIIPSYAAAQSPLRPPQGPVIQSQPAAAGAARNPSSAIAGTVVDAATGNPIPRAELTLQNTNDEARTTTDSSGKFVFDQLEPGKYQLFAHAPGYSAQGLNQHGSFFTGVVVGSGLDSEHVVFRLHPQAVIFGKVNDERGEAVRNATVQIFSQNKNSSRRPLTSQAQTNDLGEYRFAGLLPGKYFVAVSAQPWYAQTAFRFVPEQQPNNTKRAIVGFGRVHALTAKFDSALDVVYPLTFYPGVSDERSATELNLREGETQQADIALRAVPSVHLRLTNLPPDQAASPNIGGFQRIFGSISSGVPMQVAQISPGEVEIAGLPPGDVAFNINSGDGGQNGRQLEARISGDATLDASKTSSVAVVSGRVVLPQGSGELGHAGVELLALQADGPNAFARLKKDGTFSFPRVPPGSYGVLAQLPGPAKYVRKITAFGAKTAGRTLIVASTSEIQLTVVIGFGTGEILGTAMLNSRPADGILVLLLPESADDIDSDLRMDQSDSDGSFTLANITPGKYRLLAIQDGWDLDYRNLAVINPYLAKAQSIQISPNDTRKLTVEVQPLFK